jgi:hypothetical protein
VWRSEDSGATWSPAVHHLSVTITWSVAARGSAVAVAPTDWSWVGSADHGRSFVRRRPSGGGSYGTAVALGGDGSAYASTGRRNSNLGGALYRNPTPPTGGWTDVSPPVADKHVLGVATGTSTDGASEVVLAAVNGAGIWRKEGAAPWRAVAPPGAAMGFQGPTNNATSLSWPDPRLPYVYLYDARRGLFLSSDRGRTWRRAWATHGTGYAAGDPTRPGLVYLSTGGRLYRIDGARDRVRPTRLSVERAGPVAVGDDGAVYALSSSTTPRLPTDSDGTPSTLWRSLDRGTSWEDISDDFFRRATARPKWLAISSDGFLYVATLGNGVVVGNPSYQ